MKYFLYMNNDIVNSIISQAEQGLITEMISEKESGNETTHEKETKIGALARISSSFCKFFGMEGELTSEHTNQIGLGDHHISKEIIQKTLYDAAFNIAYENIKDKFDLSEETTKLGDYIEISRTFNLIDFGNLESLFEKDGVIDYLKKTEEEKIKNNTKMQSANDLNREQRRKNEKNIEKNIQNLVAEHRQQYDSILDVINAIKSIIPYKRMLLSSDGYLIPLDDKYLRDEPTTFGFKYGGQMTCVGYITNIIGKDCGPIDNNDIFFSLQHSINEALRTVLPTKEDNLYIVNPIAIYYKNGEKNETN